MSRRVTRADSIGPLLSAIRGTTPRCARVHRQQESRRAQCGPRRCPDRPFKPNVAPKTQPPVAAGTSRFGCRFARGSARSGRPFSRCWCGPEPALTPRYSFRANRKPAASSSDRPCARPWTGGADHCLRSSAASRKQPRSRLRRRSQPLLLSDILGSAPLSVCRGLSVALAAACP